MDESANSIRGLNEADNPTLIARSGDFAYVLTVINRGKLSHMLYIDGLNIQTKLLQSDQHDTITVIPEKPENYHYYDRSSGMQLLGEFK